MGLLNLGSLKSSKVKVSKKSKESLAQSKEKFGLKTGKGINLPKGNPPINK